MDSQYNSNGDKDDASINSFGYPEGYIIPTTSEQDIAIREAFTNISKNEPYSVLGNNCSTAVQRSMEAAGIETYERTTIYRVPANHSLGEASFQVARNMPRPIVPSKSFRSIINLNPQGQIIKKR